jgi:hypothetical protein
MSRPTSWTQPLLTVRNRARGEEEKDMFTTDSVLGAEMTYRQDRIR